ncbi:hypothetical protein [Alicycliphilus denitrificans]|uniref:hypothetical protein n=1 Tax=Alicycliphilus denitrificans TaxID=179636 RepID=UPI000C9FD2A8|nr:hypothetical protein [Alicycliphilus denitrificans]
MSIEDGFCTLAELADGMAAAVVMKYARPPGEVFTWQDSDGELDSMDTSENIRIVSRQNAVLEIFRLIDQGEITPLNMSFMQAAQPVPYEYFDRRIIRREQAAQILQRMFGTTPAPQPQAAAPAPVVAGNAEQRQARRWQMCLDAGLPMPQDTYAHLPRGIGKVAKAEGIKRQALAQDLNAHRERLFGK